MSNSNHRIHYTITPRHPEAHLFEVTCQISEPHPDGQVVWLPAWIPGSYMVRDFAKNIVTISAEACGNTVSLQKLDKQTWQCAPCSAPLTLKYTVYAWDLSVRTAHLDCTHAFFNGSSVFLAIKGQEQDSVSVEIRLPAGDAYTNWRVATGLSRAADTALFSAGWYQAANYDELIDCPVEMGTFSETQFEIDGIPHHIVITGRHQTDMARLCKDVEIICTRQVRMFGELPAMERYVFLLTVVGEGYGGLEHRNSTALICNRKDLPHRNLGEPSEGYITLLALFSHEYFHTWNVKQIKPDNFIPYRLEQESYTEQLWAFEGITSYYDELIPLRCGIFSQDNYLQLIGKNITRTMRGPGRLKQTLRESSFDAWTKFYKQDENSPNAIVSYYVKGGLFAFCLDMEIRQYSDNRFSLDDVMRRLWNEYGKTQKGVTNDTIMQIASEFAGRSLGDFFHRYLSTTEDMPLQACFARIGYRLQQRATVSMDDTGGKPPGKNDPSGFNLGAKFTNNGSGAQIQLLLEDSDLQRAGFSAGDVIIAINELRASKDNINQLLAPFSVGDEVVVHAFRRDEFFSARVHLTAARKDTYFLEPDNTLSAESPALQHRQSWLQT